MGAKTLGVRITGAGAGARDMLPSSFPVFFSLSICSSFFFFLNSPFLLSYQVNTLSTLVIILIPLLLRRP